MKKMIGLLLFNSIALLCYQDPKRDMYAYTYHCKELKKTWYKDRILKPALVSTCVSASVAAAVLYVLSKFQDSDDQRSTIVILSSLIGASIFIPCWVSCMTLNAIFRLIKKNPDEEFLKQSLELLLIKIKTAIAQGSMSLEDLTTWCSETQCPITQDLMKYAWAFKQCSPLGI